MSAEGYSGATSRAGRRFAAVPAAGAWPAGVARCAGRASEDDAGDARECARRALGADEENGHRKSGHRPGPREGAWRDVCVGPTRDNRGVFAGDIPSITIPSLTIAAISLEPGPEPARRIEVAIRAQFKAVPPNAWLVFIEGSRHFVMDDRPTELDRLIEDFLAGKRVHDIALTMSSTAPATRSTTRAAYPHLEN